MIAAPHSSSVFLAFDRVFPAESIDNVRRLVSLFASAIAFAAACVEAEEVRLKLAIWSSNADLDALICAMFGCD